MTDSRALLQDHLLQLQVLLPFALTPLLRQQIHEAIRLHQDALKASRLNQDLEDLNAHFHQIDTRWTDFNRELRVASMVRKQVITFGEVLTFKLLEDYADRPMDRSDDVLFLVEMFLKIPDRPVKYLWTLEEMALNTSWVEKKLAAIAARQGQPGSDIQTLIHEHDWSQLAVTLIHDREMATKIFEESLCTQGSYDQIIKGITHVRTSYFEKMESSTEYVLNARALQQKDKTPVGPNLFSWAMAQVWGSDGRRPRSASDGVQLLQKDSKSLKKFD